jgi:hypothetical protein
MVLSWKTSTELNSGIDVRIDQMAGKMPYCFDDVSRLAR